MVWLTVWCKFDQPYFDTGYVQDCLASPARAPNGRRNSTNVPAERDKTGDLEVESRVA